MQLGTGGQILIKSQHKVRYFGYSTKRKRKGMNTKFVVGCLYCKEEICKHKDNDLYLPPQADIFKET